MGGLSATLVRPRPSYVPFAFAAGAEPLAVEFSEVSTFGAGGAFSSMGESGGGGMSVPSVRE
jgi:hypothetical protein